MTQRPSSPCLPRPSASLGSIPLLLRRPSVKRRPAAGDASSRPGADRQHPSTPCSQGAGTAPVSIGSIHGMDPPCGASLSPSGQSRSRSRLARSQHAVSRAHPHVRQRHAGPHPQPPALPVPPAAAVPGHAASRHAHARFVAPAARTRPRVMPDDSSGHMSSESARQLPSESSTRLLACQLGSCFSAAPPSRPAPLQRLACGATRACRGWLRHSGAGHDAASSRRPAAPRAAATAGPESRESRPLSLVALKAGLCR